MKRLLYKNFQKLKTVNTLPSLLNTYSNSKLTLITTKRKTYYLQCMVTGSSKRIFLKSFSEKKFSDIVKTNVFAIKTYSW